MKLIIGLGNPEEKYENTRHNVGFRVLDSYLGERGGAFKTKDKFRAEIAELKIDGEKVLLAKPTTYYNLSGEAGRLICDFYKLEPADVLVIHDELALPFGTIRTRIGGSDAGNNGVKSITQRLDPSTARLRVGVYNDLRASVDDADFVLSNFTRAELERLPVLLKNCHGLIDAFGSGTFETTTHVEPGA